MTNQNLYFKILEIVKSHLYLALELLHTMPPAGVLALLRKAARLLPINTEISMKDFPFEVENPENRLMNFKAAFDILVQKIISALISINKERSLLFYTDIELHLSMSLKSDDPADMEENDNFIINLIVTWQTIWPEIILQRVPSYQEATDRLYDYILRTALPSIKTKDFLRVGYLYADITLTEARGYRLNHEVHNAIEMPQEEAANLMKMKSLKVIYKLPPNTQTIAKTCFAYIEELINLIDQLRTDSTKKSIEMDHLAIKLDALLHDYRRIYEFSRAGDCLLSYAEPPSWERFGSVHHAEMACLDGLMRELEELAVERIDKNYQKIETTSYVDGFEIKEEDFFEENILTFWTNRIASTCPIPFWEVETSTGLFKNGEDWHEFHPYKPMCYLSHIAFVDGDINFEELKYIDYITWEMRFRHDITVNISGRLKN